MLNLVYYKFQLTICLANKVCLSFDSLDFLHLTSDLHFDLGSRSKYSNYGSDTSLVELTLNVGIGNRGAGAFPVFGVTPQHRHANRGAMSPPLLI